MESTDFRNEDARFWDALTEGRFLVQRCVPNGHYLFPPAPSCWQCGSVELGSSDLSVERLGTVYTYTVCHSSFSDFAKQVPYTVVIGDLPRLGGLRVLARLAGADASVTFGDPVELVIQHDESGRSSYAWKPVG